MEAVVLMVTLWPCMGRSMKNVGGAVLAGSTPPFLGRERAAVDVDVGPERRSPRYHDDDVYYYNC